MQPIAITDKQHMTQSEAVPRGLELNVVIDRLYSFAKKGDWERIVEIWANSPAVARRCSRFRKRPSKYTFLHQAAFFGKKQACEILAGLGADLHAKNYKNETPADVASRMQHETLAAWLREISNAPPAPADPDVLPCSFQWLEAVKLKAPHDLLVLYYEHIITIPKNSTYYTDRIGRVLVGFHGSYDPPRGMDGAPIF
ncbi:ankyrin repeat domain-containing protein [Piscinibacter sp. Jin2]|uniref:Ankyrin repeat domain-containing protein n=1 Tax=Aquariibacter lacus TaxID=2801332 RepID=A0A9X1BS19_9BURK|nr:ankyrin repeat domain-containing protein [Piscinibacter lacus]MBL0720529.1 ankyrin repeat domain-containing protein [Piscinibacter lacus]